MPPNRNKLFSIVKWLVMLAAYGFLIYKLANIEYWNELKKTFQEINFEKLLLLIMVVLLMPVNWLLEAVKWQKLIEKSVIISLKTSLKSVLAGLSTGYITPNRIGDFAGRLLFLPKNSRLSGIILSIINSLTQNIVITIFGILGAIVFFTYNPDDNNFSRSFLWIGLGIFILILICFALPLIIQKIKFGKWNEKINEAIRSISNFKTKDLLFIILISALRYFVFCTQYFLMLHFFRIEITALQALYAIPAMYLLITFTPSLAASEPAIRGSYAVLIFSAFSTNAIGIMLTGILIWLINFVVPMVAGTVIIGRTKRV